MKKKPAAEVKTTLPLDIRKTDLDRPKWDEKTYLTYSELKELGLDRPEIVLYRTKDLGWVITTLFISNPSKRSSSTDARTYAIGATDSKIYTVGCGPHVLENVTVYLTKDNVKRLQHLIDQYRKGLADAGSIRDRISSRRAQGQQYRAAGRTSWMW